MIVSLFVYNSTTSLKTASVSLNHGTSDILYQNAKKGSGEFIQQELIVYIENVTAGSYFQINGLNTENARTHIINIIKL